MTDTRQFIVCFDRRHDAAAIARIEQQPSMSEYIRELVRRDTSDENARLWELMRDTYDCICEMYKYMDGGFAFESAEADPTYGPILKRMREMRAETQRIAAMLPADKHGKEVKVGCMVHLDHNGRDRRVTALDYVGHGAWIVGCDEGGSFMLPQSRDNITVLAGDDE